MINLLPPDTKKQIRAARMNVVLSRMVTVLGLSLIVMVVGFGGALYITTQQHDAALKSAPKDSPTAQATKQKAQDFAENLKAAKSILESQISYTTFLTELTNTLPPHTVLTGITLTRQSFGSQMTLSALAGSTNDAINLKSALAKSGLFTNVSFQNLADNSAAGSPYHQTVTLSGTLTANPPIIAEEDQK